jgi:hypothetical protein
MDETERAFGRGVQSDVIRSADEERGGKPGDAVTRRGCPPSGPAAFVDGQ